MELSQALRQVKSGGVLQRAEAHAVVAGLLEREFATWELVDLLIALAARGETPAEIAGAADALRERMLVFEHDAVDAIDTCGTGGDGLRSFNVSTAAAIVAAAAGARVVKHGNRSQSSRCGSADLLEAAGIPLDLPADRARACLDEAGITFLFAPTAHPLLARVAPVRKALGIRTLFNYLGPLCNPGRVRRQLLGVPEARRVAPMADALRELGHERAYVVHGAGGADELMPGLDNLVHAVGDVPAWNPAAHREFRAIKPQDLRGGDARDNLAILARLLDGALGPVRDAVVLNAGAALVVAGVAAAPEEGLALADAAIAEGRARTTMNRWVATARGRA